MKDKLYLISEEELKEFKSTPTRIYGFAEPGERDAAGRVVDDFLKSKTPVEEVGYLPRYNNYGVGFKHAVVRQSLLAKMEDIIYKRDNFRILIEEIE